MAETLQKWKVECEDGFSVVSAKEHELVQHVPQHVKDFHQKLVSKEDVMKMVKRVG